MKILEYSDKYRISVNNLIHEIMVDEFGFYNFSQGILDANNYEYLKENCKLWIVVENGEVIATTGLLERSKNEATLKKVYVKKNHRGKGIAQKLLDICINYATNQGYQYIFLDTYNRLENAKSFYAKNGFIPYYNGYDKPQGDEIKYKLKLTINCQ